MFTAQLYDKKLRKILKPIQLPNITLGLNRLHFTIAKRSATIPAYVKIFDSNNKLLFKEKLTSNLATNFLWPGDTLNVDVDITIIT